MNDYDSEQGRELRLARITRIRPRAAPDMITKRDFTYEYKDFHIVRRELMPDTEEWEQCMFCPACQEDEDDELVRARKLHVSYNEDPLRNYRALITVACKGCGWSEIIPVSAPEGLTEDELSILREKAKYEAQDKMEQMRAQMGAYNQSLGLGQQQLMNAAAQRQAPLAQMYGAGPQVMKSLLTGRMATLSGMNTKLNTRTPTRGQALADHVWSDYAELDKMREEAKSAKGYVEGMKARDEMVRQMAEQMAKKVDEDIMTAPPPPVFPGGPTPISPIAAAYRSACKELRDAVMAAPAEVRPSLLEKLKGYFR